MIQAEVMDLTAVCQSFPRMPVPEVHRDNILSTMDAVFGGETELVVVEGEEGIPSAPCPSSQGPQATGRMYDPHVLRYDLCNQLQWVLHHALLNFRESQTWSRICNIQDRSLHGCRAGQEVDWGGLSALVDSPPGRTPLTALLRDCGSVAGHRSVQAVEG